MASDQKWLGAVGGAVLLMAATGVTHGGTAPYPRMAPTNQYMMEGSAEIALARSAAVPSISNDAGVMVLGAHGFETAAKGTNGFVCIVERAWDKAFSDPEFWNPKMRAPVCMNAAAVSTVLPVFIERAKWVLSGFSREQMEANSRTSRAANMPPAAGAMSYMMSKGQYLSDSDGQWYPHVMFFAPHADPGAWGANLKGSPVFGDPTSSPFTLFFIPVRKWSDGALAVYPTPATAFTPADSTDHHR